MDWIPKLIDAIAKYAWGVVAASLFVLFAPEPFASNSGIARIRGDYAPFWWIALIFSSCVWIGDIFSRVCKLIGNRQSVRKQENQTKAEAEQRRRRIELRLSSLSTSEQDWFRYCLLKNCQTMHATKISNVAQSLCSKRLLVEGGGSILSLPYTIPDDVWEFLLERKDELLPPYMRNDPAVVQILETFAARQIEVI